MEQILIRRLHSYIIQNNPELLLSLEGESLVSEYLSQKVATVKTLLDRLLEDNTDPYLIEEECLSVLTHDLRPSKFHYICNLLKNELPATYKHLQENGLLTYAVSEIVSCYIDLFEEHRFSESEDTTLLDEALTAELLWLAGENEAIAS